MPNNIVISGVSYKSTKELADALQELDEDGNTIVHTMPVEDLRGVIKLAKRSYHVADGLVGAMVSPNRDNGRGKVPSDYPDRRQLLVEFVVGYIENNKPTNADSKAIRVFENGLNETLRLAEQAKDIAHKRGIQENLNDEYLNEVLWAASNKVGKKSK